MIQIDINGQSRSFASSLSIAELLVQLQFSPDRVVVELNRNILIAEMHAETQLNDGDSLELIQFVGGG